MNALLSRLGKVKPNGEGRYIAQCPAHDDRSPSLSIKLTDDGRTLVHCFAGCPAREVVEAVGLSLSDLYPLERSRPGLPQWKRIQLSEAADYERTILQIVRADLSKGESKPADIHRAGLAMERLKKIREALSNG